VTLKVKIFTLWKDLESGLERSLRGTERHQGGDLSRYIFANIPHFFTHRVRLELVIEVLWIVVEVGIGLLVHNNKILWTHTDALRLRLSFC